MGAVVRRYSSAFANRLVTLPSPPSGGNPHSQVQAGCKIVIGMKNSIKINPTRICATVALLALWCSLAGCAHEVSHTERTKYNSDGTVKSKETTVRESPNGTVTKTEESKTTTRP